MDPVSSLTTRLHLMCIEQNPAKKTAAFTVFLKEVEKIQFIANLVIVGLILGTLTYFSLFKFVTNLVFVYFFNQVGVLYQNGERVVLTEQGRGHEGQSPSPVEIRTELMQNIHIVQMAVVAAEIFLRGINAVISFIHPPRQPNHN